MEKSFAERFVENVDNMRRFQQERAIVEVTDLLEEAMKSMGLSRSQFAKKLGKSKPWVTQLLDGEGNKTVRTIADAFAVLGLEYRSSCDPIRSISNTKRRTECASPARGQVVNVGQGSPILRVYTGTSAPAAPIRVTA